MAMGQNQMLFSWGYEPLQLIYFSPFFFLFEMGLITSVHFPHANHNVFVVGYGSWFEHVQEFWEHHMDANVLFLKYEDMHKVG